MPDVVSTESSRSEAPVYSRGSINSAAVWAEAKRKPMPSAGMIWLAQQPVIFSMVFNPKPLHAVWYRCPYRSILRTYDLQKQPSLYVRWDVVFLPDCIISLYLLLQQRLLLSQHYCLTKRIHFLNYPYLPRIVLWHCLL